jgi:hypothetical protein
MENKELKNKEAKKKPSQKKVDLSKLSDRVDIIALDSKHMAKGKEHNVTKDMAIVLINKGAAKLK